MANLETAVASIEYEKSHEQYGKEAAAWMASSRETVGDILIKNAALDNEAIPMDVVAMAAANYRSAITWQRQGVQLAPSSSIEPISQIEWPVTPQSSPQLISGIDAATEYLATTAPVSALPLLDSIPSEELSLADGLEGLIIMIFGTFMPWFIPQNPS